MCYRIHVHAGHALIVALAVAACAPGDTGDTGGAATDSPQVEQPAAAQPGALTDAQIAQIGLTANSADSANGELAQQQASAASVKAFGQRMVQDHGAANRQAEQLAQSAGLTPAPSDISNQLQSAHQQTSQHLQGLSGAAFDSAYINHEVQLHQQLLDAADQQLLPAAQNPQLRQYLESLRTTIQSHLEQARQIQGQLGGQSTGGR